MTTTDACECGHSIDRHGWSGCFAGIDVPELTGVCRCTRKPSDILAARVAAAVEQARAEVVAKVRAALVMSDHEPTNRVWHEQMQRVRAALSDAATPEAEEGDRD